MMLLVFLVGWYAGWAQATMYVEPMTAGEARALDAYWRSVEACVPANVPDEEAEAVYWGEGC